METRAISFYYRKEDNAYVDNISSIIHNIYIYDNSGILANNTCCSISNSIGCDIHSMYIWKVMEFSRSIMRVRQPHIG